MPGAPTIADKIKFDGLPKLDDKIRIERRTEQSDGAGNTQGAFARIGPASFRAQINELRSFDETVIAAKLQGTWFAMVIVRASAFTRSITTEDRVVHLIGNNTVARTMNIRYVAPPSARSNYVALICEDGVAT